MPYQLAVGEIFHRHYQECSYCRRGLPTVLLPEGIGLVDHWIVHPHEEIVIWLQENVPEGLYEIVMLHLVDAERYSPTRIVFQSETHCVAFFLAFQHRTDEARVRVITSSDAGCT